ncbi:MAG TPA: disulfide bond formation protein B [Alphaproteobacteria bacterium]
MATSRPDIVTNARLAAALLLVASAAVLSAAFAFQYLGGLAPCVLCLWQRYPYGAVIGLSALALVLASRRWAPVLLAICGVAFLVGAGIAAFHVGVEQHWWQGTAACGATQGAAASLEALRAQLMAQPVVRCDEIPWALFGISMAGYNFVISLALAAFSFAMAWRLFAAAQQHR